MKDASTKTIHGTYRKDIEVTHYFNQDTKLNVMINATDNVFLSAWKLGDEQLQNLINEGNFF